MSLLNELEMNIDRQLIDNFQPSKDLGDKTIIKTKKRKTENIKEMKKRSKTSLSPASTSINKYAGVETKFAKLAKQLPSDLEKDKAQLIQQFHICLDKCKMTSSTKCQTLQDGSFSCSLHIDTIFVAEGIAPNKKEAKVNSYKNAIVLLREDQLKIQKKEEASETDGPEELELVCGMTMTDDADGNSKAGTAFGVVGCDDLKKALENFVIYYTREGTNSKTILHESCNFNKISLKIDKNKKSYFIKIKDLIVSKVKKSKKDPLPKALDETLEKLKSFCYSIVVKEWYEADEVYDMKREDLLNEKVVKLDNCDAIPDSNIGVFSCD